MALLWVQVFAVLKGFEASIFIAMKSSWTNIFGRAFHLLPTACWYNWLIYTDFLGSKFFLDELCKQRWMNAGGAWQADRGKLQSSFSMAFLRLRLDCVWSADPHFKRNVEKLERVQWRTTEPVRVWRIRPTGSDSRSWACLVWPRGGWSD